MASTASAGSKVERNFGSPPELPANMLPTYKNTMKCSQTLVNRTQFVPVNNVRLAR